MKGDYKAFKQKTGVTPGEVSKEESMRESMRSRRIDEKTELRKTITPGDEFSERNTIGRYSYKDIDIDDEMKRGTDKGDCQGCELF
jgi:hypothetical protein